MELKHLLEEVERLESLVKEWTLRGEAPAIERDLALDMLRRLYLALRFEPMAASVARSAPDSAPASRDAVTAEAAQAVDPLAAPVVDLGAVLSLGGAAEVAAGIPTENGGDDAEEPATATRESAGDPTPPEIAEAAEPAEGEALPKPDAGGPAPQTEPRAGNAPDTNLALGTAPEADLQTSPETAPHPESEPLQETASHPESEPLPETTPDRGSAPQPEADASDAPVVEAERPEAETSRPAMATLFGIEEEHARHRHKQRVIMSLYDYAPGETVGARPAASDASSDEPAHVPEASASDTATVTPSAAPGAPAPAEAADATGRKAEPTEGGDPTGSADPADPAAPRASALPHGAVLGEVIAQGVHTLAESLEPRPDVASALRRSEKIDDLGRAIGINDKFLMIRDLFDGDGAAFDRTVAALNGQPSLDDCMIYIAEHFAWNPDSDGAKLLVELLERKFC